MQLLKNEKIKIENLLNVLLAIVRCKILSISTAVLRGDFLKSAFTTDDQINCLQKVNWLVIGVNH